MRFVLPLLGLVLVASLAGCGGGGGGSSSATKLPPTVVKLTISPGSPYVVVGAQQQFTASLNTTNTPVTWSVVEGAAGGTITTGGLYTAPSTTGTFHVMAVSAYDSTNTATATVTVIPAITITPAAATLIVRGAQNFSAIVNTTPDSGVSWGIKEGAAGGSLNVLDLHDVAYTAPSTAGTYHLIATNNANTALTQTAVITVIKDPITITPASAAVLEGAQQQFTATSIKPPASGTVNWTVVEGSTGGTVTSTGLYTAGTTPGTYHVQATDASNPAFYAIAPVTVVAPISVSPTTAVLLEGTGQTFTASESGAAVTAKWSIKEGASGGTITQSGVYTAPNAPGTFHVVATDPTYAFDTATAVVTVIGHFAITPPTASILENTQQQFTATQYGQPVIANWSIQEGSAGGSITSTGLYTAPAAPGAFHVVATDPNHPSLNSAVALVTSVAPISIDLTGPPLTPVTFDEVVEKGTISFTALENGVPFTPNWRIQEGSAGGTISPNGLYTAPSASGTFHVIAQDPVYPFNSATVTIQVLVPIKVSPATVTMSVLANQTFTATLNGVSTPVNWSVKEGTAGGTITSAGVYTAPALPGTYHVIAASQANSFNIAVATITVQAGGASVTVQ